jgi:hypothetical protein
MTTWDDHNEIREKKNQDQSWNKSIWKDQIKIITWKKTKKVIVWIHSANKNAFMVDATMNLLENNINHIL